MRHPADGDIVAVWGAGPVGQFAMDSARVLGAAKVIAIDEVPVPAARWPPPQGYTTINYSEEPTSGRRCWSSPAAAARTSASTPSAWRPPTAPPTCTSTTGSSRPSGRRPTGRTPCARRSLSCRSGGIVSVIGVYGGFVDKFPAGAWMNRALTLRTGQCHVQRYMRPLLERIERGEIDPTRVITHRLPLAEAPHGYEMFKHKQDDCEKVVLKP